MAVNFDRPKLASCQEFAFNELADRLSAKIYTLTVSRSSYNMTDAVVGDEFLVEQLAMNFSAGSKADLTGTRRSKCTIEQVVNQY